MEAEGGEGPRSRVLWGLLVGRVWGLWGCMGLVGERPGGLAYRIAGSCAEPLASHVLTLRRSAVHNCTGTMCAAPTT